ncbi:MAG TPA: GGDEF domain-containing protein [Steroidobacteraceae bacterium]|nr:GGDEF domain-containing protein [Steroidobacteraceae bacterium]
MQASAEPLPKADRYRGLELELLNTRAVLKQVRAELARLLADEKSARYQCLHDSLTALPNRSFFRQQLDHALDGARESRQVLSVFYLDLDGFKALNDTHGHDAGDQVLRIVGARLARAVRAADMVSRMGGDEFACLLAGLENRGHLRCLAEKLSGSVCAPMKFDGIEVSIRPSIGIATFPTDAAAADSLLKSADAAMYRAKRQRTGHAFFADHA